MQRIYEQYRAATMPRADPGIDGIAEISILPWTVVVRILGGAINSIHHCTALLVWYTESIIAANPTPSCSLIVWSTPEWDHQKNLHYTVHVRASSPECRYGRLLSQLD